MARTITGSMAAILEELELEGTTYVTYQMLENLIKKNDIKTSTSMFASRLREKGWLLATDQKGVWEYAPAAVAGAYSNNDPLAPIKTFSIANPDVISYLTLQTAAWAMGLADRVPSIIEAAVEEQPKLKINPGMRLYTYKTNLETKIVKGVKCLSPEGVIVHIASDPKAIKSWDNCMEWLPEVVYESEIDRIIKELEGKPESVRARTGYLLQGMYPDAADAIYKSSNIKSKNRFGARTNKAIRNDEKWKIVDTAMPMNPKEMERVK